MSSVSKPVQNRSDSSDQGLWYKCRLTDIKRLSVLHYSTVYIFSVFHTFHYENMSIQIYWKFYHQKMKISVKKSLIFFHISAQNLDCGYSLEPPQWGGSNEYPQSKFLNRNMKNNVYHCKPQFYYIKVGFKGSKLYRRVLVMFCHECFSMVSMTHFPFLFSYIYIIYVYDFALIVSYFRCNVLLCIMHILFDVCNVCVFVDKKGLKEDWPLANWSIHSK